MDQDTMIDAAHIEGNLRDLWLEIDGLDETAEDWPSYDDDAQLDFELEWHNLMGGFKNLVRAEAAGVMTAEQHSRYERLVHRYEEQLPLIKQLKLSTIPVPKLSARTS